MFSTLYSSFENASTKHKWGSLATWRCGRMLSQPPTPENRILFALFSSCSFFHSCTALGSFASFFNRFLVQPCPTARKLVLIPPSSFLSRVGFSCCRSLLASRWPFLIKEFNWIWIVILWNKELQKDKQMRMFEAYIFFRCPHLRRSHFKINSFLIQLEKVHSN